MCEKSEQICEGQGLDHGALNVPLAKRGSIDAQIDRFKADKAKQDRRVRQTRAEKMASDRVEAKSLLAAATDGRLAELAVKCQCTVPALRKQLRSDAHWQPRTVIGIFAPRQVPA